MTDVFSPEVRSRVMSHIHSKDTTPEKELRQILWSRGYRYRIHYKLSGKPDIVFASKKTAVFIDGCFWHKCPKCYIAPKSNKNYWHPKLQKNIENDKKNNAILKKNGWLVIRIWEHEIREDTKKAAQKIIRKIS